jgi:hypothetical protein
MSSDVDTGRHIINIFHWPNPLPSSLAIEHSDDTRKIVQVPYFQKTAEELAG